MIYKKIDLVQVGWPRSVIVIAVIVSSHQVAGIPHFLFQWMMFSYDVAKVGDNRNCVIWDSSDIASLICSKTDLFVLLVVHGIDQIRLQHHISNALIPRWLRKRSNYA